MLDTSKIAQTPKDGYEAIDMLVQAQSKLVDAIFIMKSVLACNEGDYKEINDKKIFEFIKQFEK